MSNDIVSTDGSHGTASFITDNSITSIIPRIDQVPNASNDFTAVVTTILKGQNIEVGGIAVATPESCGSKDVHQLIEHAVKASGRNAVETGIRIAEINGKKSLTNMSSNKEYPSSQSKKTYHHSKSRALSQQQKRCMETISSERKIDLNAVIHEVTGKNSTNDLTSYDANQVIQRMKSM